MGISAVLLAKNEEKHILKCLESLEFCDEIVVIDDNSNDRTLDLAKNHNSKLKIFKRNLDGDFAGQRNFGLEKAVSEWVFFVDADEVVTNELKMEIIDNLGTAGDSYAGYFVKRKNIFLGRSILHGEMGSVKLLRLGKKGSGKWKRRVHEYWEISGAKANLKNSLIHESTDLREFVRKINWYSQLHLLENRKDGKRSNIIKIIFFPIGKFIDGYVVKLGFLDGVYGLVIAILMSFHSFLSWSNLWLENQKK